MSRLSVDSPSTLPDWVFPWPAYDMAFDRSALMVIDYQNYSVNPACGLARLIIERHPEIALYYIPRILEMTIPNTRGLLQAFREAGREVIEVLAPLPGELVIDKNSSSPFNGTGIDQLLRNLGTSCLFLTGVATDMCVENTARDASDRGFHVVVVDDAVATFVPEHHYAALSALARVYAQVWSTADVRTWLAARREGKRP